MISACGKSSEDNSSIVDCSTLNDKYLNMIVFGDSQSMGVASHIGYCRFSWAYAFSEKNKLNLINKAIGGTSIDLNSDQGPSQEYQIKTTSFNQNDLVFWILGFNDAQYNGLDYSKLNNFKKKLEEEIKFMSLKVSKIYVGTPFKPKKYYFNGSKESFELYSQAIKDVVNSLNYQNVELIDVQTNFEPKEELFDSGLGHLNQEGQLFLSKFLESNVSL